MVINLVQHFVSLVRATPSIDPGIDLIPPTREVGSPVNLEFVRNELGTRSTISAKPEQEMVEREREIVFSFEGVPYFDK